MNKKEKLHIELFHLDFDLKEMRSVRYAAPDVVIIDKNNRDVEYEVVLSNLDENGWTWLLKRKNLVSNECTEQEVTLKNDRYVFNFLCRWWHRVAYDRLMDIYYEKYVAPSLIGLNETDYIFTVKSYLDKMSQQDESDCPLLEY